MFELTYSCAHILMATDSSDESVAPKDFHLSSSCDSGSRLSVNHHKCQLCYNFRKSFHCKQCIRNGDFVHSTSHYSERFAEKKLRYLRLRASKRIVEEKCTELLQKKIKYDLVVSDIRQCKERINLLKHLLNETRNRYDCNTKLLSDLYEINKQRNIRLPRYEDRVGKLERYVESRIEDVERRRSEIIECQVKLKHVTRTAVHQLIEYIFPISKIEPTSNSDDGSTLSRGSDSGGVSAGLAEAQRMAYVRGRWVQLTDSTDITAPGELRYRIVAPTLPGSGDYSAYSDWVASHKEIGAAGIIGGPNSSMTGSQERNTAFTISAALTYTAQLVNVLAFYLDVRLPYKLIYSDFCSSGDMTEGQFARRVARLNGNILHLCFSQGVKAESLRPAATIHNLLCLMNPEISDLGRRGPVETEPSEASALEEQLTRDLETSEDDSGSEEDICPWEWEAVPHVQCPEVGMLGMSSQHGSVAGGAPANVPSAAGTASMAGGLVTSAAASIVSLWRGWTTGGK